MQARRIVEVAGLLSVRAAPLLSSGAGVCSEALAEYWIASRCRIDRWGRTLRELGHSHSAPPAHDTADVLARLSEEITLSEVLTRVVAAVCLSADRTLSTDDAGPIGLNAIEAHREAASRLRALIFAWWPADSPRARRAQALSDSARRWTDLLLAYIGTGPAIERLAFDSSRLREFAYDVQSHGGDASRAPVQLLLHGLQTNFADANLPALNPDLNRRVAGAVMALFGDAGFDGHGLAMPLWMLRAERVAGDTEKLLERLFETTDRSIKDRLPERWWI